MACVGLALAGCVAGPSTDGSDTQAVACPAAGIDAPVVERTDIGTVARVTWSTPEAVSARVVYDNGDGVSRATGWDEPTTEHEHLAWGVRPGAEYQVVVELQTSDGVTCSDVVGAEAGELTAGTPAVYVDAPNAELGAGGFAVFPVVEDMDRWLVVTDEAGVAVWSWHVDPSRLGVSEIEQAFLAADGRGIVFIGQARGEAEPGLVGTVAFDGELVDALSVNGVHTSFVPLPDGGWGALGWEVRSFDDGGETVKLLGDTILEVAPDGTARTVWNVFSQHTPDLSEDWMSGWYLADPDVGDWSHVNWISYDPAEDDFLVSATFNDGVFRIDRETGAEVWSAGTVDAQVIVPRVDPPLLNHPHSVVATGDELLVFNRNKASDQTVSACSQAVSLAVGEDSVSSTWAYGSEECQLVPFMGNAEPLSNGNTLVVFSASGVIDEVTPDGTLVQRLTLDSGAVFGFGGRFPAPE